MSRLDNDLSGTEKRLGRRPGLLCVCVGGGGEQAGDTAHPPPTAAHPSSSCPGGQASSPRGHQGIFLFVLWSGTSVLVRFAQHTEVPMLLLSNSHWKFGS